MNVTIDRLNPFTMEQDALMLDQMTVEELREIALDYGVDPSHEKLTLVVEIARAMHR